MLEKARMHFKGIKCGDGPHDSGRSRMQERLTCSSADDEAEERESSWERLESWLLTLAQNAQHTQGWLFDFLPTFLNCFS